MKYSHGDYDFYIQKGVLHAYHKHNSHLPLLTIDLERAINSAKARSDGVRKAWQRPASEGPRPGRKADKAKHALILSAAASKEKTITELASTYGASRQTVYRIIKEGTKEPH